MREQYLGQVLSSAIQIQTQLNHAEKERTILLNIFKVLWKSLWSKHNSDLIYEEYTSSVENFTDYKLILVSVINLMIWKVYARQVKIRTLVFEIVNILWQKVRTNQRPRKHLWTSREG